VLHSHTTLAACATNILGIERTTTQRLQAANRIEVLARTAGVCLLRCALCRSVCPAPCTLFDMHFTSGSLQSRTAVWGRGAAGNGLSVDGSCSSSLAEGVFSSSPTDQLLQRYFQGSQESDAECSAAAANVLDILEDSPQVGPRLLPTYISKIYASDAFTAISGLVCIEVHAPAATPAAAVGRALLGRARCPVGVNISSCCSPTPSS
jgi:hypothetical protein